MMARISFFYDRYLAGVNWKQCAKTMVGFYSFVIALLVYVHVPAVTAGYVGDALTFAAFLIYLIIPKPARALLDNLVQQGTQNQDTADRIVAAAVQVTSPKTPAKEGASNDAAKIKTNVAEVANDTSRSN